MSPHHVTVCTCTVFTGGMRSANITCPIHSEADAALVAPREPELARFKVAVDYAVRRGLSVCISQELAASVISECEESAALVAGLRQDSEAARDLIRRDAEFQEWAQGYLDAGRWAGHDRSDAIKTELLERDAEVAGLRQALNALEVLVRGDCLTLEDAIKVQREAYRRVRETR